MAAYMRRHNAHFSCGHGLRSLLLATTILGGQAMAADRPAGFSIAGGSATVSQPNASTTVVHQATDKAIINWTSFSISPGNSVVFEQPGVSSIALNRVTSGEASDIAGTLRANGQVWLINPNGILFGPGARVNVGGLLATTADIRDRDFLAGIYKFAGASNAPIVNYGQLRAAVGGYIGLAAARVDNRGLIEADVGTVAIGAGQAYAIDLSGDNLLRFAVTAPTVTLANRSPLVTNIGTIAAPLGHVVLTARAARDVLDNVINTSGIVVATRSRIEAGNVVIDAGDTGTVAIGGTVDAANPGAGGTGGNVTLVGHDVALTPTARIDASGSAGGGNVFIGGLLHGSGPENAATTSIAKGAVVTANALAGGNGGQIVAWSENSTSIAGRLTANGGAQSGNGGFIETSSHGDLAVSADASINTAAPKGLAGNWLLDPLNVTIGNATANGTYSNGYFNPTASGATVDAGAINASLNAGTAVTIQTGSTGSESGDITVAAAIAKTAGADTSLSLTAAGSIIINAPITSTTGNLGVNLTAGSNITANSAINANSGYIFATVGANGQIAINSAIGANRIDFSGGNDSGFTQGAGATIATSAGQRLYINTDTIALLGAAGSITGTGQAILQPNQATTTIGLGNGAGSFNLTNAELATLSGFTSLQIGYYYDTGLVSIGGPVNLTAPTTFYANGAAAAGIAADVTTALTVANGAALDFQTPADVNFAAGSSIVSGPLTINAKNVSLGSFAGSAGVASTLSITAAGNATIAGNVNTNAAPLIVTAGANGQITIGGAVSANRVDLSGGNGSGFTQNPGASIATSGGQRLYINTDTIALLGAAGSITGTGQVILQPNQASTTVGLGTGAGSFNLTNAELATLSGFSSLQIGYYYDTGLISIGGPVNFAAPTAIYANGAAAAGITADATTALNVANGGTLDLQTPADVSFAAGSSIVSGPLTINAHNVALGSFAGTAGVASPLSISAAGNVTIAGSVNTNAAVVSVTAGTNGQIAVGGAISGNRVDFSGGNGSGFTQGPGATIATSGGQRFYVNTDTIDLQGAPGSITGTGLVTLEPNQVSTTIGLGTGAGTFSLTNAELATLSGFGSLQIGYYYETGLVSIGGPVNFTAPTAIYANGAAAAEITADATTALTVANGGTLNIQTLADVSFAAGSSIVSGPLSINANNVVLGSFAGTAGVASPLSISAAGNVTIAGGVNTNAAAVSVTAGINGQIAVGGAISGSRVDFSGGNGSGFTQGPGATIATSGGNRFYVNTDTIALLGAPGSITGTGQANLEPNLVSTAIGLGTGAGSFNLNNAELATLSGFSSLQIGYYYDTGLVSIGGPINFTAPTTIYNNGGGASGITADAATALTVAGGGTLTLQTQGDATFAAGSTINSGQFYLSGNTIGFGAAFTAASGVAAPVTLSAITNVTVSGPITTNNGGVSITGGSGGIITENAGGTIAAGTGYISVNTGASGQIAVNGALSGGSLTFTGGSGSSFAQGSGATIASVNGQTLAITTDAIDLQGAAGSITGSGALALQPAQSAATVGIGTGAGAFQVSQAELDKFSGFNSLRIGYYYDSGLTSIGGAVNFAEPTTIYGGTTGLSADATAALTVANAGSLTLQTQGEATFAAGSTINSGQFYLSGNNIGFGAAFTAASGIAAPVTLSATNNVTVSGSIFTNNGGVSITGGSGGVITETASGTIAGGTGYVYANTGANGQTAIDGALSGGTLSFSGGIDSSFTEGSGATIASLNGLSITADTLDLQGAAGSIAGSGLLGLQPAQTAETVGIGTGAGAFQVTQATLDKFSGFNSLRIGYYYDSGLTSIGGAVNFAEPTTIYGGTTGLSADATAALTVANAGSLTLQTQGDATFAAGSTINSGQLYLSGNNIAVGSTINTNNNNFSVNVSTNGTITQTAGSVDTGTSGLQIYLGSTQSLVLHGALKGANITLSAAPGGTIAIGSGATIAANGSSNGNLDIQADLLTVSAAAGAIGGTGTLNLSTASSGTTIGFGTGAGTLAITQLALDAFNGFGTQHFNFGSAGAIAFDGPLTFSSNAQITPNYANSVLNFGPTSLISVAAGKSVSINGGSTTMLAGTANFGNGTVNINGGTLNLSGSLGETAGSVLAITAQNALTLSNSETLPGTTNFLAPSITLGALARIDASGAATSSLIFQTYPNGSFSQTSGATVTAGSGTLALTSDAIQLNGPAGSITGSGSALLSASQPFRSIGVGSAAGTLQISQATIDKLSTFGLLSIGAGGQTQTGLVAVDGPITLHQATKFNGSIDLKPTAAITTDAVSPITVSFVGVPFGSFIQEAGSTIHIGSSSLAIQTDNLSEQAAANSDIAASLIIAGSSPMTTIGVGASAPGTLLLQQSVFDGFSGVGSITIGQPGTQTGITSLGGTITTPGVGLTFAGPVNVMAAATVRTNQTGGSANIAFASTVDGASSLVLNAGTGGTIGFASAAGSATPLASLSATASTINLPSVTTTGAQTYQANINAAAGALYQGGSFSVSGSTTLLGSANVLTGNVGGVALGTVDGPYALGVTASNGGTINLGAVGANTQLASLALNTTGQITLIGAPNHRGPDVFGPAFAYGQLRGGFVSGCWGGHPGE
jgi:filamentous hemagglutinin family protein